MEEAIKILDEIEENVGVCCAITMEPDEVLELIDKLRKILEKHKKGNYHAWKFVAFKLFMFTMGYSTLQGDSIIIRLGITKLETFFSFTIKDRWTR